MKISLLIIVTTLTICADIAHAQSANSPDDETMLLQLRAQLKRSGMTLTPEQELQFIQRQRAMQDKMKAAASGLVASQQGTQRDVQMPPSVAAPFIPASNSQTDESIAEKVVALPIRPTPFVIEDRKDGFVINGKGFVDPEGSIRNFAINPVSGIVTYMAETGRDSFVVKIGRAGTDAEAIPVAFAQRIADGWQVETATGKKIRGASLTMLAGGGFLVARETGAFIFSAGKGLRNVAIPKGYIVAAFQRGDVLSTDYLLLERDMGDAKTSGSVGGLFNSFKALGATLGLNVKEDYALINIGTNEIIPIDISEGGKVVSQLSQCRRKNSMVNTCASIDFRESLYDGGERNLTHYYWRINWFSSSNGPVLIALENSLKNVTIRDLRTGKKIIAFSRALGIARFDAVQNSEGNIRLEASVGFSREKIDDVVAHLRSAPAIPQVLATVSASADKEKIESK